MISRLFAGVPEGTRMALRMASTISIWIFAIAMHGHHFLRATVFAAIAWSAIFLMANYGVILLYANPSDILLDLLNSRSIADLETVLRKQPQIALQRIADYPWVLGRILRRSAGEEAISFLLSFLQLPLPLAARRSAERELRRREPSLSPLLLQGRTR